MQCTPRTARLYHTHTICPTLCLLIAVLLSYTCVLCLFVCLFSSVSASRPNSASPELCPSPGLLLDAICVTSLCLRAFLSIWELCHFLQHTVQKMWWLLLKGGQYVTCWMDCCCMDLVSLLAPWAQLFAPSQRLHWGLSTLTLHFHSALVKQASTESRKEPDKKAAPKHSGPEQRTSHLSQAHLLAGAVKRRRYAHTHPLNLH